MNWLTRNRKPPSPSSELKEALSSVRQAQKAVANRLEELDAALAKAGGPPPLSEEGRAALEAINQSSNRVKGLADRLGRALKRRR